MTFSRPFAQAVALALAAALAGCGIPVAGPSAVMPVTPTAGEAGRAGAQAAGAGAQACSTRATEEGFAVQSVADTREVADGAGMPVALDVVLRVSRAGQGFDLRCSYDLATGQPRLMTL